jgi:uncharacterized protein (DUF1778 family)
MKNNNATSRIEFRIPPNVKSAFKLAAQVYEMSLSEFIIAAAIEAADAAIRLSLAVKPPVQPRDGRRKSKKA